MQSYSVVLNGHPIFDYGQMEILRIANDQAVRWVHFEASVTVRPAASLAYHPPVHEQDTETIPAVEAPQTPQVQVFGGVTTRSPFPWRITSTASFLSSMIKALQGPSTLEYSELPALSTSRTSSHWIENLGSFDQESHTSGPTGSGIKVDSLRSRSPRAFYINFQPRHKIGDSNAQHHEAFEMSIMTTTNPGSANSTRLHSCLSGFADKYSAYLHSEGSSRPLVYCRQQIACGLGEFS